MNKTELKKLLKQYHVIQQDIDTFNAKRQMYTYTEYKNEIYIHVGNFLTFCLNFKKSKTNDYFSYSGICANGNELQINKDKAIELLYKYLHLDITEAQIIEYIS